MIIEEPNRDVRICFVGESFVNGTGDRTHLGWTGRLCQALSQRGDRITYYNLGIRRETTTELLARWQQDCDRRLPPGCHHRVVFSFGVNDTTLENGSTRVTLVQSLANARQILSVAQQTYPILMVGPAAIADKAQNVRINELSVHFAHLCETLNVPYLHIFTSLSQSATWMQEVEAGDGAHPDAAGYAELACLVQKWSAWKAFNFL
ncbi:lipase [Phormidium sp. FACHB-592]|uniref:GDSL-type esterase/lipase family protein n=1 Tax=Stenomitos frigidus AS-A4 TaxID=2933935 RepID=A0ABV0KHG7_9CYAN|nr:GDSL-type esterase/lipase family protein [Phormidium sp. FACHB-592]MBD2073588.1 lipase [Phormidium sp. FACHB-592]